MIAKLEWTQFNAKQIEDKHRDLTNNGKYIKQYINNNGSTALERTAARDGGSGSNDQASWIFQSSHRLWRCFIYKLLIPLVIGLRVSLLFCRNETELNHFKKQTNKQWGTRMYF